jgi:hypothetical protein
MPPPLLLPLLLLVLLAAVSDCGMVLELEALLPLAEEFGLVELGLLALGFADWSEGDVVLGEVVLGEVLWLGLLGVVDGCWSGVLGLLWVCGVDWVDELELGLDWAKATAVAGMSAKNKLFFIGVPTPGFDLAIRGSIAFENPMPPLAALLPAPRCRPATLARRNAKVRRSRQRRPK